MLATTSFHFQVLLGNLFKARFPYLYIPTWEEERVLSIIRSVATDPKLVRTLRTVFTWKLTDGITGEGQAGKEETKAPLKALEFIEKYSEPAIFVLVDFHIYFGERG